MVGTKRAYSLPDATRFVSNPEIVGQGGRPIRPRTTVIDRSGMVSLATVRAFPFSPS
jgi:hypothetical protein